MLLGEDLLTGDLAGIRVAQFQVERGIACQEDFAVVVVTRMRNGAGGPFAGLKNAFKKRKTVMHNPEMTFVQPSDQEMARLRQTMARKLNRSRGNTGVRAFVKGLQEKVKSSIPIKLLSMHINDESFAAAVVEEFEKLIQTQKHSITKVN